MSAHTDFNDVVAVLDDYFAGLRDSDTTRLKRVFHAEAHYFCGTSGTLQHLDMAQYFPVVDARPSPSSQGHVSQDRILSIEFAGPVTAFVKAECSIPSKFFTDFLVLIKLEGRWQIVSKVFHYETTSAKG
jgi:Putative lumazine-binding